MNRILLFCAFVLSFSGVVIRGDAKVWTGLSPNLPPRWDDADNWKPSAPGELDDVIIGEPPYSSPAHITVSGPIKVKSLSLNRTTLIGAAQFEVTTFTSKGAALTDGGAIKITSGGSIYPGPTGEYGLSIYGWTIDNEGLLTITDNGTIKFFAEAGRLNNAGTIDFYDNAAVDGLGGNGSVFLNSGTVRKATGIGKATINALQFVNNGQVFISSGKLSFPSGSVVNTGQMALQGPASTIVFEGARVDLSGGALTGDGEFTVRANSVLTVNVDTPIDILNLAGDVTGPAKLTVQTRLVWTSGTLSGAGEVISVTQLTIQDPPGGGTRIIRGRTLRNKMYALWASGDLQVTEGGRIENELTGEFTIGDLADKQMSGSYLDSGGFFNAGVVKFIRENGRTTSIYCQFSNSNRVEYSAQLLLYGGGAHSGTFAGDSWGKLRFVSGTNYLDEGFDSTSWNGVTISGGVMQARGLARFDTVELAGGSFDGSGDIEASHGFGWTAGTIGGSGRLRTMAGGVFYVGPNNSPRDLLQRTVEIFGVMNWDSVNFSAGDGAVLRMMASGRLNMGSSQSLQHSSGAECLIENFGIVSKPGNGTTYLDIKLVNRGNLMVDSGKLEFAAGFVQESGFTQIQQLSEIQADKGMSNQYAGEIRGFGKLSGNVVNYGTIEPGMYPTGILTIGSLTQKGSGRIKIKLDWVDPGSQYDQLKVEGTAVLDGEIQIEVRNGFTPGAGARFDVLICLSQSGQFKVKNGNYVGGGVALIPEYSPTKVTLVGTTVTPEFPTMTVVGAAASGSHFWGWHATIGNAYQVEYSNDLVQWFVYANITADRTSELLELPAPVAPEVARFYRIR